MGTSFFDFLHRAGLIRPDRDFACSHREYDTIWDIPVRMASPFPSSDYANIDLAPALLQARCFGAAQLWLTERCRKRQ